MLLPLEQVRPRLRPTTAVAARTCRGRGCRRSLRPGRYYCYDHWDDLIGRLGDKIERITDRAAEIYIGRTCDPDARRVEHFEDAGRENLTVLHWSDDIDEVCAIEEALIREFDYLRKLANADYASSGGGRADLRNYVYVSWRRTRRR